MTVTGFSFASGPELFAASVDQPLLAFVLSLSEGSRQRTISQSSALQEEAPPIAVMSGLEMAAAVVNAQALDLQGSLQEWIEVGETLWEVSFGKRCPAAMDVVQGSGRHAIDDNRVLRFCRECHLVGSMKGR